MDTGDGVSGHEGLLIGSLICELDFRGSVRLVWGFARGWGLRTLGWELMEGLSGFAMGKGFMIHGQGFHVQGFS